MKLKDPVLGENLEFLHCELECQRSARPSQLTLLNSVVEKAHFLCERGMTPSLQV